MEILYICLCGEKEGPGKGKGINKSTPPPAQGRQRFPRHPLGPREQEKQSHRQTTLGPVKGCG